MVCVVHGLVAPTPTTFSAATDTLSQLEVGFEGGSKVWLHLTAVQLEMFTFSIGTTDTVRELIWYWYCGPGHASPGLWREIWDP